MKRPINHNPLDKPQDAISKGVKEVSSSPGVRREKAILFQFGVGLMIVAFLSLTFLVVTVSTSTIDLNITKGLQSIKNPAFSWIMTSISWVGFWPQAFILTSIIIVFIYRLGYHWESAALLIAASIEGLLNMLIKILIHRPRPSADLVHVTKLLNSYSFPSGHVMFYTAFFGFICFLTFTLLKQSWIRSSLLLFFGSHVVLIGLSRIYLGEHWASDVIAAYLVGGLCLVSFIQLYRYGKTRFFLPKPSTTDKKQC
jgi:undecaprenyl-diphosphatase